MRYKLLFSLLFLWALSNKHYAQTLCSQAQPVCAGVQNIFPGQTSGVAQSGLFYGCLSTFSNPSWHTLDIGTTGTFTITIAGSANGDVDYICYGPFSSTSTACSSLGSGTNVVGCSYSNSSIETLTLNATAGDFYVLLVPNYSGANQSVIITQTGGTGLLNCSNVCDITGITSTVSSCGPSNTYSVSGVVSVNGVPTIGSLTITNTCGGTAQVFNAPFPSPITYSFINLPANGSACNITAMFSALTTCSLSTPYVAPSVPTAFIASTDNPLCNPGTATLTAGGSGTSYTWSTGSNSSTIAVSPPVGTNNYNVTVANTSGCSATAAFVLTVAATPASISAFALPGFICSGTSATLVATAIGASGFTWQPGSLSGNTVVVSPAATTAYTVTASNGICSNTAVTTVNVLPGPVISASTNTALICPGDNATLSVTGAAISYTWYPSGTIASSIVVSPNTTTTYSVVGISVFGCTSTVTVTQPVNPRPSVAISPASPTLCAGTSIALNASGTATSFTWTPGNINATGISVSPLANAGYTLTGSDGVCTNSAITTVTVVALPLVNASSSSPTVCSGLPVSLLANGATNYTWNPGSLNGTPVSVSPVNSTTYTVVGESNGCTSSASVAITVINNPTLNATSAPAAICPGGSFTLNVNGASSYTWNPGGSNLSTIIVSPATSITYVVTGANASGCTSNAILNLTVNPAPSLIVSASPSSVCIGGSSSLGVLGAASYTWNPGNINGSNVTVSPLVSTNYTVTGISALGCTSQTTVDVIVVPLPPVSASGTPGTICSGGSATLTGSGAASYAWSPGGQTGSPVIVSPISNTTYTVTGTSAGCSNTATVSVAVIGSPNLVVSASPATVCPGGSSNLLASGALTYTWSPGGSNGANIIVTPAATTVYTVDGTNAAGCSSTNTVMVTVSTPPSLFVSASSPSICAGDSDVLTASGAASYTWTPGGSNLSSISVSPASSITYSVTGANSLGCTSQGTVDVVVVALPTVGAGSSPATICNGDVATLTGSGATSYLWNPGGLSGSSVTVAPTSNTTYTVTGTAAGCSNTAVTSVAVTNGPTILITASPATICPGGSSTLIIGGSAVSFTWVNGGTIAFIGGNFVATPTITTTYTLSGINVAGCVSSSVVTVVVNTPPTVLASASSPSICLGSNVTLTASGATSYTWSPVSSNNAVIVDSPVSSTTYTLIGDNGTGCTAQSTVAVTVVPLPPVSAGSSTTICNGDSATLTGSGATSYLWNPGGQTGSPIVVSPASNTTYTVTGTSAGCSNTAVVSVAVNSIPNLILAASPPTICPGNSSTLTANGASTYTWNPGGMPGSLVVVSPIITTVYTVTGANAFGCTATDTVEVTLTSPPTVVASASSPSVCFGGNVTLTASGATTYNWFPGGSSATSIVVSPTASITYTLVGFNTPACGSIATVFITVVQNPTVNASASPTAICNGGSTTLNGLGASSYVWNPGNLPGASVLVSPTSNTTYTVTGTSSGCSSAPVTVFVQVNNLPSFIATAVSPSICAGASTTLSATGSATSYTWQPGNLNGAIQVVTPASTTVYTVTGVNAFGCTDLRFVTVVVNAIPTITVTASSGTVCSGSQLTLLATGATSYTWNPGGTNGAVYTTIATGNNTILTYTTIGSNAGCTSQTITSITVASITPVASSSSVCVGNTATLSASGPFVSYIWNPGSINGQSVSVTPALGLNTYTVNGTAGALTCSNTISLFGSAVPSISVSPSQSPVCAGTSVTLTASGGVSYTWQPINIIAPAITLASATNTTFIVTGANAAGCTSSTIYVLGVNATTPISATASSLTICQGFTTNLIASGAASSTNYTWSAGSAIGNNIPVNPPISTIYTVNSNNGFCISSATVGIIVIPAPLITATATPASMCSGQTVTLTASGATSYTWLPMFSTGATVTNVPSTSTTYTVVGFGASGCPNFALVPVTVFSSPTVAASPASPSICMGSQATFTPSGATSYTLTPGTLISTGSPFTVTPGTTTTYTLIGDNGGCASGSATFTVTVNALPTVTATSSANTICGGQTVALSAGGAVNYTWNPVGQTGVTITDTPLASVNYTVIGQDANGCLGNANVSVTVTSPPPITVVSSATAVCQGGTVSLTASGANNFTWSPGSLNGSVITDTPAVSTIYTVSAQDPTNVCVGSATISVAVVPIPTINVTPVHTSACSGSPVSFTATGATSYTWLPSGNTSSISVETPTGIVASYTVIGDNGGNCPATFTVDVAVIALPDNVVATANGTITCTSPTLEIDGSSTSTDINYSWTGPLSFTSGVQNPTVTAWGVYTLAVTNTLTGCVATATVDVPTDGSIPSVTATTSGSITCSANSVTLNAVTTTSNPGYAWIGPGGFSSTLQTVSTSVAGDYTIVVVDLTSTCMGTTAVTVGTHTYVSTTATIIPATCTGETANNDGSILVSNFGSLDKFDLVPGLTYTGSATYSLATLIPTTGIITNNLANPTTTLAFTLRLFDSTGCIKDTVLILHPTDCVPKWLGIAKAAAQPVSNTSNGTYNVTYTVVVKNYGTDSLGTITLTEDLSTTFPAPATFTVASVLFGSDSAALVKNSAFDGHLQTSLTDSNLSKIAGGDSATLILNVIVKPAGFFGPFRNSIDGHAISIPGAMAVQDSSFNGANPDPDGDGNPANNSYATIISLQPQSFFGITKNGSISNKLSDNSYDLTYSVTVYNSGNDTLYNIVVKDSLFENTIKNPATYSIKTPPVADSLLIANSAFDGQHDVNLTLPGKMPPGRAITITFVINIHPDTVTVIKNSAFGNCITRFNVALSDTSNMGDNPDSNGNFIGNEPVDNIPTVLTIRNYTLFIPQGFSPDGDAINEFFVIEGLPTAGNNSFTVFNRWGNKVYHKANYDNTWEGYPNVGGSVGSQKLPQGTYYFILEMKGSGIKPVSGFIVLQY